MADWLSSINTLIEEIDLTFVVILGFSKQDIISPAEFHRIFAHIKYDQQFYKSMIMLISVGTQHPRRKPFLYVQN